MADIIVGEKVINKAGEKGRIASFDGKIICVVFENRTAKLQSDAFERGFLKYENANLQGKINEGIEQVKKEKEQEIERKRLADKEAKEACRRMEKQAPIGVKFNSVSIRLESAPVSISSVKEKHKALVREIFNACDEDIGVYYASFHPEMKYIAPRRYSFSSDRPEHLRSRYCVGFLTKYAQTYVLRVISRNDVYAPGMTGGFTVANSDTTEILRILCIDGEVYCFSKNLSCENGRYKNSTLYKRWQASAFVGLVNLDEVIRTCDCNYLNDYINEKDVNCLSYAKLCMAALHNNKAEIVFKNKLFSSTVDISRIDAYLEEFSSKQIDFASKNDVINTLPIIKRYGIFDVDILLNLEKLMRKGRNGRSTYDALVQLFTQQNLDLSVLDKKLIGFLRKTLFNFDSVVYGDYINELINRTDVPLTVNDVFNKDYREIHYAMMQEKRVHYSATIIRRYLQVAQELSWIDREENDLYIIVPKSIDEFQYEGQMQHNCVYTNEYFLDVIDRQSIIVFLRQEKDIPYVTVEFVYGTFEVRQAYKKYNQRIDDELYLYVVNLGKQLKAEMLSRE